jgi:hypothetical protein
MQFFKGDSTELKYYESGRTILETLSGQKSEFFTECYGCFVLGELLYDNNYAPLANAIPRDIFRESFAILFESFLAAGSFESYITVFQNIFGADVEITFTVPAPGKLNIDIVASGLETYGMTIREIIDDAYEYFTLVDDEGDRIVLQAVKGFESQYELEQMLFEMVPAGIYTEITLTVGEE